MPNKASYKSKGGKKDSAAKNSFNPPSGGDGHVEGVKTRGTEEQDTPRKVGQFTGAGQPAPIKK